MKIYTEEEILTMWPQALAELRGLLVHFQRTGITITGSQLEMALQLAQDRFVSLQGSKEAK